MIIKKLFLVLLDILILQFIKMKQWNSTIINKPDLSGYAITTNINSLSTNSVININNLQATSNTTFNNLNSLSTNSIMIISIVI
jgi:hypothetical protein